MNKTSSELFKNSIDKAFSQPGITINKETMQDNIRYKQSFKEEKLEGGRADKMTLGDIAHKFKVDIKSLTNQFNQGCKVEMEHTNDKQKAKEIALDHLAEDPKYYSKLKKMESKSKKTNGKRKSENNEATGSGSSGAFEGPLFGGETSFMKKSKSETPKLKENIEKVETKEATTSGSVGSYETPSMWAKSTKKKDWGPSRKTQLPGGSFVKVRKKCTKFPYCNQGDIKALKITKNESVKEAIKKISKKFNIKESVIINILEYEYNKINKRP